jgi:hypothetical protein
MSKTGNSEAFNHPQAVDRRVAGNVPARLSKSTASSKTVPMEREPQPYHPA